MKTFVLLTALSVIILAGCSTSKSTTDYDDVYATTKKKSGTTTPGTDNKTQITSPDYYQESGENVSGYRPEDYETGENVAYKDQPYLTTTETVTTPEGTNYITNNYYEGYGNNDYYDYSYAERINRFYGPYMGYNYYAPCYTGYYYDPWYWDSYWYRPSLYFGFSWGWGGMYWGYPYYYPYYSYYPYNSYWYGYNNGYWNGYYDGYYGYNYYNPGNYYGHRSTRSGSNNSGSNPGKEISSSVSKVSQPNYLVRTTPQLADNFAPGRTSTNVNETPGRSSTNSISDKNTLVVDPKNSQPTSGKISEPGISGNNQEPTGRTSTNTTGGSTLVAGDRSNSQNVVQEQPKVSNSPARYTYKKPEVNTNATKGEYKPGQTIESNNSSRPAQKYSKPADNSSTSGKVSTPQQGTNTGTQNRQTYTRPQSNNNSSYSKPSGYNNDVQQNNQPARSSSNSYSQPSRSSTSTQPSNSSKSYSPPSNTGSKSSSSYSAPSRSSSSGSSSPSSSSSSGSYSSPSRSSGSSGSSSSGSGGSSGGSRGGRK